MALLFASCLEFVGIYPVVFLIAGHAFPGYWRSDKAWWRLQQFASREERKEGSRETVDVGTLTEPLVLQQAVTPGQSERWLFDIDNLVELLRFVQEGSLVPFESTFVTARRGFFQSLETGLGRLQPETFDAMLDVQLARVENVTPLPLFDIAG